MGEGGGEGFVGVVGAGDEGCYVGVGEEGLVSGLVQGGVSEGEAGVPRWLRSRR